MNLWNELRSLSWSPEGILLREGRSTGLEHPDESTIAHWVYQHLHTRSVTVQDATPFDHRQLIMMRKAVPHAFVWEPGWRRRTGGQGSILIERSGITLHVREDEVRPGQQDTVEAKIPAIRPRLSPGFIHVTGPHGPAYGNIIRIYFSCDGASAPDVTSAVLGSATAARSLWTYKAQAARQACHRTDGAVLYVAENDLYHWLEEVERSPLVELLQAETSAFVNTVTAGVGWAREWSSSKRSYGDEMSRIVAASLIDTLDGLSIEDAFRRRCALARVDPTQPWNGKASDAEKLAPPDQTGRLQTSKGEVL